MNGDRLTGVVDLDTLGVDAIWGKVSIPLQHMSVLLVRGGPLTGSTPFDVSGAANQ